MDTSEEFRKFHILPTGDLTSFVLHAGLKPLKQKNSRFDQPLKQAAAKPGAVFMVPSKEMLKDGKGIVMQSLEAVVASSQYTHWTPNIFRYGTYYDRQKHTLKGTEEHNLRQINTLVVDADFGAVKPTAEGIYRKFILATGDSLGTEIWPTLVLETPHGYQAYYVLDKPIFVSKRADGRYPAIDTAKRVSENLRKALSKQLPQVDLGANHLGFFRTPNNANMVFFEPALTHDFSALLSWSKRYSAAHEQGQNRTRGQYKKPVDQPWFEALSHAQITPGHHNGLLGRNNTLLTLMLACYASGQSYDRALDFADEWASCQYDSLTFSEIKRIVKSAYSGKYAGPKMSFVKELLATHVPGHVLVTGHGWYKHAKPRDQRQKSHLSERVQDLVKWLGHQVPARDEIQTTMRDLGSDLGVKSMDTLSKLIAYAQEIGLVAVKRVYGRNGGIYFKTRALIGRQVQRAKRENANKWQQFLASISAFGEGQETPDNVVLSTFINVPNRQLHISSDMPLLCDIE